MYGSVILLILLKSYLIIKHNPINQEALLFSIPEMPNRRAQPLTHPYPYSEINFSLTMGKKALVCAGHAFSSLIAFDRFRILEDDETVTMI